MRSLVLALLLALPLHAQDPAAIDKAVTDVLARTGAPSASVAVVKEGKIVHLKAYGIANLETKSPATTQMRYSIGSISKQFTAAAILLLAEEGRLSLDDKVVRWFPELTRAKDVSVRQLLSMTSGYQDFWPQDYVMPGMLESVAAQQIIDQWARKPLDFEPGSKYQYSNTNYVMAGLIVERVSGMPFMQFLEKRIFRPVGMSSVYDTDVAALGPGDPARYMRLALAPVRPAPKEGKGWMFAAGGLAMTARDLALWDISVIDQSVLQPASYREMQEEVQLTNGVGARYGLGVGVSLVDGRRLIAHGGEVSGFTARNEIYPDDRAAIVVLTNLDATDASAQIATKISSMLFAPAGDQSAVALARRIFGDLQKGRIDRSLFTSNANAYFSDAALSDFASSLGPLGAVQEVTQERQGLRGGMTFRRFLVKLPKKSVRIVTYTMPDGKFEQYIVTPE